MTLVEGFGQVKDGERNSSVRALLTRVLHDSLIFMTWEGDSCTGLLIKSLPVMKPREGHLAPRGYGMGMGDDSSTLNLSKLQLPYPQDLNNNPYLRGAQVNKRNNWPH